jgi:hypothetical protein
MSFGSIVELKEYDNCTHVDAQIDVNLEVRKFCKNLQGSDATKF